MAYVDGCAELSKVDWRAGGLEGLGKPEGSSSGRSRAGWRNSIATRPVRLPELDFVTGWLEDNRPEMSPAAIIHGDYSPFNVMVAPDPPVGWPPSSTGTPAPSATRCSTSVTSWRAGPNRGRSR